MFETGEIWSVDTFIMTALKQQNQPGTRPGIPYFEDRFKYGIHAFRTLLSRLGLRPPFRWVQISEFPTGDFG
jgi:hypothetical protein